MVQFDSIPDPEFQAYNNLLEEQTNVDLKVVGNCNRILCVMAGCTCSPEVQFNQDRATDMFSQRKKQARQKKRLTM